MVPIKILKYKTDISQNLSIQEIGKFRREGKIFRTNKSTVIMTTNMCQIPSLQSTGLTQRVV